MLRFQCTLGLGKRWNDLGIPVSNLESNILMVLQFGIYPSNGRCSLAYRSTWLLEKERKDT